MTEKVEREFFVDILRPVLLKIAAWIARTWGIESKCGH